MELNAACPNIDSSVQILAKELGTGLNTTHDVEEGLEVFRPPANLAPLRA